MNLNLAGEAVGGFTIILLVLSGVLMCWNAGEDNVWERVGIFVAVTVACIIGLFGLLFGVFLVYCGTHGVNLK